MAIQFISNQPIIFQDVPNNFALPYLLNDTISFQYKKSLCQGSENLVCNPNFELGDNLIVNGNFSSGLANWIYADDTWELESGKAVCQTAFEQFYQQSIPITNDKYYKVSFEVSGIDGVVSGALSVSLGADLPAIVVDRNGSYFLYIQYDSSVNAGKLIFEASITGVSIDNVSIQETCWYISSDKITIDNALCYLGDLFSATASQTILSAIATDYIVTLTIENYVSGLLSISVGDADITGLSGNGTFSFVANNNGNTLLSINFPGNFLGCITNIKVSEYNTENRIDILDENNEIVDTIAEVDIVQDGLWILVTFNVADYITDLGCYRLGVFDSCLEIPENPTIDDYTGVSNTIKILSPSSGDCGNLLFQYRCNNSAFGFDFTDADFKFYIRLNAKITNPKFPDVSEMFDYSSGVRRNVYSSFRKIKTLNISFYPEYVHEAIALMKACDYISCNSKLYVFEPGEYAPDANTVDEQDLMTGQLELSIVSQPLTKRNCADALPSGNYLLDPQTGDFVKSPE